MTKYSGAKTPVLLLTECDVASNLNLYRLRATNEWGARYSEEAELFVGPQPCFWTPPASSPDGASGPIAAESDYGACYLANTNFISIAGSAVATSFQNELVCGGNSPPPPFATVTGRLLISICIAAAGPASFDFIATKVSGSYAGGSSANVLRLYDMDGNELDVKSVSNSGDLNTTLSLSVPAPGQYMILMRVVRTGTSPGNLVMSMSLNRTLEPGDVAGTIE